MTSMRLVAAYGVEIHRLQRPSIRAGSHPRHPILSASVDASRQAQMRRPHLYDGVLRRPRISAGHLHQHPDRGLTPPQPSTDTSLSTAPAGITPVSSKRQSAMSNLRATATIPIRRKRLPPLPKRSRNHTLRALSDCKRSQLHANSVVIQRTCRLPALVIPCSRALAPLWYGVGVKPAKPPTSRRFLKARQPKNSITNNHAPLIPIPLSCINWRTWSIHASAEACSWARRSASTAAICALRNV